MNKENLEKANKLSYLIENKQSDIQKIDTYLVTHTTYLKSPTDVTVELSEPTKDIVLAVVKSQIEKELKELQAEFEAL